MKKKQPIAFIAKIIILSLAAVIVIFPLANLVMNSLKSDPEYVVNPAGWPQDLLFSNYIEVFFRARILSSAVTSILITFTSVILILAISSLAAFALTKMNFEHETAFRSIFALPMLLSMQVVVLPVFLIYARLSLLNTYHGAIIIYVAHGLPLAIMILDSFFQTVPNEICDAARIDGASQFQVFYLVALPLTKTPLVTVAILNVLWTWNDFFVPFMFFTKGDIETLPLSILHFMQNYTVNWPLIFADVFYIITPVVLLYLLLQRYVVRGVTAGALVE